MKTSNTPFWGANWQDWWKSPWMSLPSGAGIAQDPAAMFSNWVSLWSGSHPAITMPAGSIAPLMKDAATAWSGLMTQAASHQAIVMSGWQDAFAAFAKDLNVWDPAKATGDEADSVESLDQLLARWTATAEPILQEHAKSEAYIASQSTLMRAAMNWQKAQAAITESFCKQMGIPTRSEVDDAFRMIHELRRARRRDEHALRRAEKLSSGTPMRVGRARAKRGGT
jgi:Poly(R)-hydroxyalkanoic acid synthase subunit (PHA_synth_III_E)